MSSKYSEQPEFGTDPYSYVIGQPLPKRESHKPMESWSDSHYHPSYGTTTVSLHNWERSYRSVSFGDYDEDGVYKLSTTYIDKGSGVVEDVHGHYILGGSLLERVKRDFDRYVIGAWQTARSYHKEFPHHTIVKLSRVLDPTKDPQPKYMNTGAYIEVKDSDISGYSDMCLFSTRTPKGTSSFQGKIYYFFDGRVGRTESYITRNTYRDFVVKTFVGGRFDTEQIEYIYDSKYGVIQEMSKAERRRLMTEKSRWEKKQREEKERLEKLKRREEKAREAAARKRVEEAERAKRAAVAEEKKRQSDQVNQYIVDHYGDCTQPEMARALGISTKAVEHRVSRLRNKGLIPLTKGSNVYRDKSEIEQEERLKQEKQQKQAEERAAERKKRRDEEKASRDAIARERKEHQERIDQYIIDNCQKYVYWSLAMELGISTKALQGKIRRLRKAGKIPPAKRYDAFDWQFGNPYTQGKGYHPPHFEG